MSQIMHSRTYDFLMHITNATYSLRKHTEIRLDSLFSILQTVQTCKSHGKEKKGAKLYF